MSYDKDYEEWDESIFLNKFALFWLIAIIVWSLLSLYLFFTNWTTDILSFRNQQSAGTIKEVTKTEFAEKVNTKGLGDIVKALEQNSNGSVKLCEDSFCKVLLEKIDLTYVTDVEVEKTTFRDQLKKYFGVTDSQFESQFKNLTGDTFLLRDRYFDKSFYKPLMLEDSWSYYIILSEQFENKEQLALRKAEFIKSVAEQIKALGLLGSLESKEKTKLFVDVTDDLIRAYTYSFVYQIEKKNTTWKQAVKVLTSIFWPKDSSLDTSKETNVITIFQDPTYKLEKLNQDLNKLFIRETIVQVFEKWDVLAKDLIKVRQTQRETLEKDSKTTTQSGQQVETATIKTGDIDDEKNEQSTTKIIKDTTTITEQVEQTTLPQVNSANVNSLNN